MRAPPDTPYMFPLESAMDELAVALRMDPVELRRINDTQTDPVTGRKFSSRRLMDCFDAGAKRFGWKDRDPRPGSMEEGGRLIGWGCASAAYPSNIASCAARVTLYAEGRARVEIAGHDIGTGAYTVAAMTAAERLGLEVTEVAVQMGDTQLPPASLAAGSSHTATITHAIAKACDELSERLIDAAVKAPEGALAGRNPVRIRLAEGQLLSSDGQSEPLPEAIKRLTGGRLEVYAENIPKGLGADSIAKLYQGQLAMSRGTGRKDVTAYAFGAQFVEVRVHKRTCEIRVPRMVGVFASGTIVNPLTAYSQYIGGMIWGLGAALLEETEIDARFARYINDNIAEYHVPVNADVRKVEAIMLPEPDNEVNPLGIKGIGEIGIVGVNAAIANAVFHATGRRVRELPIRMEDLL
jgi:xanthine dehydrogenase YagR molybdenum-binding subunit